MAKRKLIAVVGSTGMQGGGLVEAILADASGAFAARGITRDPNKPRAQALARRGVEVVRADLDDLQSLQRAFAGAWGVYGVTNFWEHSSADREKSQAKNIADAAKAAGVEHVIWSTLEDTRTFMSPDDRRMPMLQTKYRVPHFDAKGEANGYFAGLPTTYLMASFYWDNLWLFGLAPQRDAAGIYRWSLPMGDARLSGIASEDIGKVAYGIYAAGEAYVGRTVGIAGEHLTLAEMSAKLSKAFGVDVEYRPVEPDAYRRLGSPAAEEMGNMFQFYRDFEQEVVAARSVDEARRLCPQLMSFDACIAKNREKLRAAMHIESPPAPRATTHA